MTFIVLHKITILFKNAADVVEGDIFVPTKANWKDDFFDKGMGRLYELCDSEG